MRYRLLFARSPEWASAIGRAATITAQPDFRLLKATARTRAGFLECGGGEAFVKCIDTGSLLQGLVDRIRGSRARRALRGAAILEAAGLAHPKPLAALEQRSLGAVRSCCMMSEALSNARMFSVFALSDGRNFLRRKWISEAVAREIRRMHDSGIYTHDLQETNLMLEARDARQLTIYFVDLEDFQRVRKVSMRQRMLNLVHLDRSIGRFVCRSQRLRFFYNYLGERPAHDEARRLVGQLLEIRNRIERRRGRKRSGLDPGKHRAHGQEAVLERKSRALDDNIGIRPRADSGTD
jgi:tRNA A-37 threonylcarbamoyl transferase component Bud32